MTDPGPTIPDWLATPAHDFLDAIAARQPTPGGGSVAAAAGALAAAMGRMIAAYSTGPKADADARKMAETAASELAHADLMLRRLINEDAAAYAAYRDARKSGAASEQAQATALALAVPMEIAAVAVGVLRTLDRSKPAFGRNLISDLGVAAVLAEASVRAAAYNVRINLRLSPQADADQTVRQELRELSAHAETLLTSLSEFVEQAL